jgi:hypothetical protein
MAFACELESMAAVAAACSRLFQIAQDQASTRPKGCWVSTSCAASCLTRPTRSLRELTAQQPAEAADGSLVHDPWLKQRLGRGQIEPRHLAHLRPSRPICPCVAGRPPRSVTRHGTRLTG